MSAVLAFLIGFAVGGIFYMWMVLVLWPKYETPKEKP